MFAQSTVTEPRSSSAGSVATAPLSGTGGSPPGNMYSVQCIHCQVLCEVHQVLCTVNYCQVLTAVCSPPGTMYSVHTARYWRRCAVLQVICTLYSVYTVRYCVKSTRYYVR